MQKEKILVWLPSPMGDAILSTPALRAIRGNFKAEEIYFFAKPSVREILSPNNFNDRWLPQQSENPLSIAKQLKKHKFSCAILFKNSFASALAVFLAGIPTRIGYSREARSLFLTDKLYPPKLPSGKFKPVSMVDYYLAVASWIGADTTGQDLELLIDSQEEENLRQILPEVVDSEGPIIIIVPGGAFGPSKCWLSKRYAQTADRLIDNYNATVIISVAPVEAEKKIAEEIVKFSKNKLINLAEKPVSLGRLKALFSMADLVISNDTGPRHIAIALKRRVITLFGPNNHEWTETNYENEIKIIGNAPCAPCDKPVCKKPEHLCMKAITVEQLCRAAKKFLDNRIGNPSRNTKQDFAEVSKSFLVDTEFKKAFEELGLSSIDSIFTFNAGISLTKKNLAKYRQRVQFEIKSPEITLFLKRYNNPPFPVQIKNWLSRRKRISLATADFETAASLSQADINTPKTISYGEQWGKILEKKSFIITEKIPNAESLERKLPDCFTTPETTGNLKKRKNFICQLAAFVRKFHETGYRHRDLYLCHIFYNEGNSQFYLIDLARAFKPKIFSQRYRVKDITQLHYSAPKQYFSKTARIRFYLEYTGRDRLTAKDKTFIAKVKNRARRMARHDIKHGRNAPFAGC